MTGDLVHAWRALLRMPVTATVIVVSIAAAVGINTVVFSWVQARLLKPIPAVKDGASIRLIEPRSEAGLYIGASWQEFLDLRRELDVFTDVFAARMAPLYVGPSGSVERVFGSFVSDNYFSALRLEPVSGRFFLSDGDATFRDDQAVVISHRLWQTRFMGAADATGQTLRVNGIELPIVGVTPEAFQGTVVGLQFDVWLPAAVAPLVAGASRELEERSIRGYSVMGRLEEGASRSAAQGALDSLMRQLAAAHPSTNGGVSAEILPFSMSPRGPQRMLNYAVLVLQGVMLLLLLAVCGNVANLMLARASARRREIGIRLALGARPAAIARLLLTENLVLGVAGAALGAALAVWGTRALLILPMTGLPLRFETSIDAMGLAFALAAGAICGLLFGAAPAAQLSRIAPLAGLQEAGAATGRTGLRNVLMAVQVGLAVIVLIVGAIFFRSLLETRTTDPGFGREGVVLAAYDLAGRPADAGSMRTLAARILERLERLPSVEAAAIAASVPLDIHGLPSRTFAVAGSTRADGRLDEALTNTVTASYFDVMRIPLLAGRGFSDIVDEAAPPEAVVNAAFVSRYIGDGEPLGRPIRSRGTDYVIVGVMRDSLYNAFGEPATPALYLSYKDNPQPRGEIHVRVRTGTATAEAGIRGALRELDPDLPVFNVRSLAEHVEKNLIFRRIPARMFSVLAPLLLLLAAIGIYAVVAYGVSLRTREIGVRIALGATAPRVVRQFVGETLGIAVAGALVGWGVAFLLVSIVGDNRQLSASVFAGVPVLLLVVAALACWLPARNAARVDPAAVLRGP